MVDEQADGSRRVEPADSKSSRSSALTWGVPLAALLAGALLGGGVVALVAGDDEVERPAALPSAPPSEAPLPESVPAGSDVLIRVPAPCVEVAGDAETTVQTFDQLATAVRDFDARELQEIVDRLQKLRPRVEALAEQCRNAAGRGIADGDLVIPAPLPSPS